MTLPSVAIIGTRGYPSYYGGFETAVRKLAPFLSDSGWDVTVYARPNAIRLDDPTFDSRVRVVFTAGIDAKSFSTLSFGLSAALHARRVKPDVALVMNCANGFWLPILKRSSIPTVVNVDGIEWDRAKWGRVARWMFHTGAKMTARHGTRMVYDARAIASRWEAEFGVDGDYISYGGDPVGYELPLESGLEHRRYALLVARFVPENSVPEFFAAAETIAKRADVVLVGSGGYGGALDSHARMLSESNPRIHWLGHVSDDARLFSLWQHAGAYFHGHSVGGTNPALVQAMALGAPIIARDTVYNREVLGDTGIFTSPDKESIANSMLELLGNHDLQGVQSKANAMRAREDFGWDEICASYERTLVSAMGRAHSRGAKGGPSRDSDRVSPRSGA